MSQHQTAERASVPRRVRRVLGCVVAAAVMLATTAASAQWADERFLAGDDVWGYAVAASGEQVHVVWGTGEVHYLRSGDQGATFAESVYLRPGWIHLTDVLYADGDDVYVLFLDGKYEFVDWCCVRRGGDIHLLRSRDGGDTFDHAVQLTNEARAYRISMAGAGDRLDVAYMDYRDGTWDLYYLRSTDRGDTWESPRRLVDATTVGGAERPQVSSVGDAVHVVWMDDRDGNPPCHTMPNCPEVYAMRSLDGGETFSSPQRLTESLSVSGWPDIAALDDGSVLICYEAGYEDNENHEVQLLVSRDEGASYAAPVRLTNAPGMSSHCTLTSRGDEVDVAYYDERDEHNAEIYHQRSTDRGERWGLEERVSNAAGHSSTPLLAVGADFLQAIWLDDRAGSNQVWHSRTELAWSEPPDAGVPDAGVPDAGEPDAGEPDAGEPDAGVPDAGMPDAGVPDAGAPDAGVPDAGVPDTGTGGTAGNGEPPAEECAVSSPGAPTGNSGIAWLVLPALWLVRRRKRPG